MNEQAFWGLVILGLLTAGILLLGRNSSNKSGAGCDNANTSPEHGVYKRLLAMNERVLDEVFKGQTSAETDGSRNFFVIDFETTDLSGRWGSVASVAIGLVIDGTLVDSVYTLVRPKHRMTEGARAVNGLSDAELENAPDGRSILEPLSSVLHLLVLVSYNTFDLEILQDFACSENVDLSSLKLHMDAMRLATNVLNPGGKWLKLREACDELGVDHTNAHNALGDVKATAHLMNKLFEMIRDSDSEISDGEEWISFDPFPTQRFQVIRSRAGLYSIVNQDNEQVGEIVKESSSEWAVQSYEDGSTNWFSRLADATDWVKSADFQTR